MEATGFSPRDLQKASEAHPIPNALPAVPTVVAVASAAGPPAVLPYARALDSEALSLDVLSCLSGRSLCKLVVPRDAIGLQLRLEERPPKV